MTTFEMFAYVFGIAALFAGVMIAIAAALNRRSGDVDEEGAEGWFILSADNTTVECVDCPTVWALHENEQDELFTTLRKHVVLEHAR